MNNFDLKQYLIENKTTFSSRLNENEDKVKTILSKIGDIEEKIYDQYSDDEIEAKFDYSKAIEDIKTKYKDDKDKMYDALVSHLKKLKSSFLLKENESSDLTIKEKGYLENELEKFLNNSLFNSKIMDRDEGDFEPSLEEQAIQFIIKSLQDRISYYQ